MKSQKGKELRCLVKMDTTYGRKVINCVEILKDRMGLDVSKLIQDALIAYERATRESETPQERYDDLPEKTEQLQVAAVNSKNESMSLPANDLLRLSSDSSTGY